MRPPIPLVAAAVSTLVRLGKVSWTFRLIPPAFPALGDGGQTVQTVVAEGLEAADGRLGHALYALWHEFLLPLSVLHAAQGAAVLVSRHRDGEILARVLHRLGYLAVRGSTTRGGVAGLRAMIQASREGRPVGFTPDGPRGPRRCCQPGIIHAAAATELPVVPVGAAATSGWRLRSWDRFLVPAPGATIIVSYGDPIVITEPQELGDVEAWALRIGRAMNQEVSRCEEVAQRSRWLGYNRSGRRAFGSP